MAYKSTIIIENIYAYKYFQGKKTKVHFSSINNNKCNQYGLNNATTSKDQIVNRQKHMLSIIESTKLKSNNSYETNTISSFFFLLLNERKEIYMIKYFEKN